ncbi:MAG: PEGA domain-containing protein [Gammaproteobacteria bacterium]|nr:PEGA domain-containing protein [Gammaproteobacteria bacterium]MBU1414654.1 PEGA domain-containing protein [Gammaproteobacteria bacterium]
MSARLLLAMPVAALLAACAGMLPGSSGPLHVDVPVAGDGRPLLRAGRPLRARVAAFTDARDAAPREIGKIRSTVRDMHGTELLLDRDVGVLMAEATRAQFAADGMQLVGPDGEADFAVEGTVKSFSLDVAGRDERNIVVEVALRDAMTGKVQWAGAITDQDDRYAGVFGNNRASIVAYLEEGVANYNTRLSAALRENLPKVYPDAVESALPARHSVVPGVTTLQAPAPAAKPESLAPAVAATTAATGHFAVRTVPPRARVYVGDVYYGMSPLRLELPAGVATISLKLGGYRTASEKVAIRPGETTELELPLERQ